MAPCSPNDVSFDIPTTPTAPAIPGFGIPFSIDLSDINPLPDGIIEDLLDLLSKLQFSLPSGRLFPALNPNFGKDIFDSIMKLLDQFMPYLMIYKFFLPLLKIIVCVIEVLCAIYNPFKLRRAIKRLFRKCLPDFLNLFPLFALIIMIISLLLLLLELIKYILSQLLRLIQLILENLKVLYNALKFDDAVSIISVAEKIGISLCVFQNLFVLLALFDIVFGIIREILSLPFSIPPCNNTDPTDLDGSVTPDVCPEIVKNSYTRTTGKLQYYNQLSVLTDVPLPGSTYLTVDIRGESWQLYDIDQSISERFINIVDAYDIPTVDSHGNQINVPKPVFFPTDSTFSADTPIKQAPYTVDLKLFYNPANWGRYQASDGVPRWIIFRDCILLQAPTTNLIDYQNNSSTQSNGVLRLVGGFGYELNGSVLRGYSKVDGVTRLTTQANIGTFLNKPARVSTNPTPLPTDGYYFDDIEYTFKPNQEALFGKGLITLGCFTDLDLDRSFAAAQAGDAGVKTTDLYNALNTENGFPNPAQTQECLVTALSGLRGNVTEEGLAAFQATCTTCLNDLSDKTNAALGTLIGIGFTPCTSDFSIDPVKQFTTKSIKVDVNLKETNGFNITSGLSETAAKDIANRIKAYITFGEISKFTYDGYSVFNAYITSKKSGNGSIMISFDDNMFCTNTLPDSIDEDPVRSIQELNYEFVYVPSPGATDGIGKPRRNEGDNK